MKIKLGILVLGVGVAVAAPAGAKAPPLYSNCSHLNARYPHGLGRFGAHDKTNGHPPSRTSSTAPASTRSRWSTTAGWTAITTASPASSTSQRDV